MARKKWKLVVEPTLTEKRPTGEKNAYEQVNEYRAHYADGTGRVSAVTVYLDEGNGRWLTYERCDFRNGDWAVERTDSPEDA